MRFSFLCFGFCIGVALGFFIDGEITAGAFQLLCALGSVPGMISNGE